MSEPLIMEPSQAFDPNPNFCTEFESLPIPSLDDLFPSTYDPISAETLSSDLNFSFEENDDLQNILDDLDGLLDCDAEAFTIADTSPEQPSASDQGAGSSGSVGEQISGELEKDLKFCLSESGSWNRESPRNSIDRSLNIPSPASSQGSGNWSNRLPDQVFKLEEQSKISVPKRKTENEHTIDESRNRKCPRSGEKGAAMGEEEEEDEKRKARLMRNRESAQLSRQRKKQYVDELEAKVRAMNSTISDLNSRISYFMAENATLRQQLSGGAGMYPPPMAAMPYAWPPYGPYMVQPHGSQVPLVPIPRLKPKQVVSGSKAKKPESKKNKREIKKVASVSFIGVLLFMLLFGGLVPFVNVNYGGIRERFHIGSDYGGDWFHDQHRGRVLMVNGHSNVSDGNKGSSDNNFDVRNSLHREGGGFSHREPFPVYNSSEALFASLYVPKNEKLVKIDGNLIINSVMATEKAMAAKKALEMNISNGAKTGLTTSQELSLALAIPDIRRNREIRSHLYRSVNEQLKALSLGSNEGRVQQWFREGIAGPMFRAGKCTQVFQFDISPVSASGAIIPASAIANATAQHKHNTTRRNIKRNRRILHGLPFPLTSSDFNVTEEPTKKDSQKGNLHGSKPSSSVVVSVLVDPREGGDADIEGMIAPKSVSRIFVVVLLDSVKYVTYSCMLPRSGIHLVTG